MTINRMNKMTIKPKSKASVKVDKPAASISRASSRTRLAGQGPSVGPSVLVASGSSLSLNRKSDPDENQEQQVPEKKKLIRPIFIWLLALYSILCLIFIVGTILIWILASNYEMKYFMRRSGSTPFFKVETGFTWMASKFLIGSLTHLIVGALGASVLSGGKWSQTLIEKSLDKIKIFFWLGVMGAIGVSEMIDASLDYYISTPMVYNGIFHETISPPRIEGHNTSCLDSGALQGDPDINHGLLFIRINLKWFVEVLCATHKEHRHDVPLWLGYIKRSQGTSRSDCQEYLDQLKEWANDDCSNAMLLYYVVLIWMILTFLGVLFVGVLFYLNFRLTIKLTPTPRFSFVGLSATEAADLERLKNVALRVRRMGSKKNFLEHAGGSHTHITFDTFGDDNDDDPTRLSVNKL